MSNFEIRGKSADDFIQAAYREAERILIYDTCRDNAGETWDLCNPPEWVQEIDLLYQKGEYTGDDHYYGLQAEWEKQIMPGYSATVDVNEIQEGQGPLGLQEVADLLHQELMPSFRGINTPSIDYGRLDYRRAYVLYYFAPYASQLAFWLSNFGLENQIKEARTVVLIGTGPSPEMFAINHFPSNNQIFYHCIDLNPEWQTQVLIQAGNFEYNFHQRSEMNHEYHGADVSDPDCWGRLPIDFSKVDLVVCQNFLNEIPLERNDAFEQSFAALFDSLSEGTGILFSELRGYRPKFNSLWHFWKIHASLTHKNKDLEVNIPSTLFPRIGELTDPSGNQMRHFWRKKNLKSKGMYLVKTNSTSAVEHYRDFDDEVFPF